MSRYNSSIGLLKWSLIRHKFYIPVFVIVQVVLSLAVIYGFSFITNAKDYISRSFLCTGAITINILAVTCVLAPQIVSEAKQNGVFNYQKTLPISRVGILLSDLLIWGLIPLPGILLCMFIGAINFDMKIYLDFIGVFSLLFVILSLLLLGFAIAYLLPPNVMTLITQVIMIVGLLFSPIIYSEDRLPIWLSYVYNVLPFVPVSNIIRASLFHLNDYNMTHYLVVMVWGIISFVGAMFIIARRK
ncbi:ABC transporter permease [Lysinibacillus mangiferihumi]|uniref:ABC transporter permease n=1 Tax=Lysinibacillus mangiferihumi TaxID=1130819 RepID=A0A4U2Z4U0_9BACI|nr:ABC transporter permease [Lysinibacillus mangiferihumi]TKI69159.1 ABC transporter permease [Lysinibacillus mangiferihumi]